MKARVGHSIAVACFFFSGVAALMLEVVWIRRAALVFGSTTFALSTVLAVFFLGLALGSYMFGRVATRVRRPLRVYGLVEIVLAGLAALTIPGFGAVDSIYGAAYRAVGTDSAGLIALRVLLVAAVILPPTLLMGASLPLFCRRYAREDHRVTSRVGQLYAVNTLGAAVGCLAAGIILIPGIGMRATLLAGAVFDCICGALALWVARRLAPIDPVEPAAERPSRRGIVQGVPWPLVAVLLFLVGLVALGAEVLWTRFLALVVRTTAYTYVLTLAAVLLGIVVGSAVAARVFRRPQHLPFAFGTFQVLTALSLSITMRLPATLWQSLQNDVAVILLAMLPAAVFSGASFPLAVRMAIKRAAESPRGAGTMTALNTVGGIAGSLAVGFFVIPTIGIEPGLRLLTGISLLAGTAAWLLTEGGTPRSARAGLSVVAVALWLLLPTMMSTEIPEDYLARGGVLVDHREGYGANLAVINRGDVRALEIDRWWQGENRKTHQVMAAHVPMVLHPDPRRVVVVGAGTGQTTSRFLMYDVDRVDCVDIEPALFDFVRRHFDSAWMDDPRVRIVRADGRNYLRHTGETYDVVSLEVGQIFRPGVAAFYTADFYEDVRARLEPGGLVAQFVPLPFFTRQELNDVLCTFEGVFPGSVLWYNTSELLLLGTRDGDIQVDGARLSRILSRGPVRGDLDFSYWGGPEESLNRPAVFLSGFLMDGSAIASFARAGSVQRDDLPRLEYTTRDVTDTKARELSTVHALRGHLSPISAILPVVPTAVDTTGVARLRSLNLGAMWAAARIRQVNDIKQSRDFEAVKRLLADALRRNSRHVNANRMMGDAFVLESRFEAALPFYRAALAVDSTDGRSHYGLGLALHQLERIEEAWVHYQAALRARPRDAELHNNAGALLAQAGRLEEARHHFEQALQLRPGDANARANVERVRADMSGR